MMRRAAILSLAVLAGCSAPRPEQGGSDEAAAVEMVAPAPPRQAAPGGEPDAAASPAQPVVAPMLAYAYRYRLELPSGAVSETLRRHERACTAAGPAVCQVTGAQVASPGADTVTGVLELRATRAWLTQFREGLPVDAKTAGGRVAESDTRTEDLTRQIVDTEARQRALATLSGRLEALLASRPGKLQELLEVERELARVQGELDATRSGLAVLRTRVATETLTLQYTPRGVIAPDGAAAPVSRALSGVLKNAAEMLGFLITLGSYLAPVLLLVGLPGWLLWRRRKTKRARPADA